MWNELPSPFVIGHRGDFDYAPENTLSSFKQAIEKGADGIEFDVKLSADGQVIVIHDQTVNRTTNGAGNVANLSLAAIQELDASVQFPGQFPGERIPTLTEVFKTVGNRTYMNVELTNYSTPRDSLVAKVVDIIKQHKIENRILFSSFYARNLRIAYILLPDVPRALLTMPGWMGSWGRTFGWRGNYAALNPYMKDVNAGLVSRVHSAGKKIITWKPTSEEDIKLMIGYGVDGLISDDPAKVLRLLGRR